MFSKPKVDESQSGYIQGDTLRSVLASDEYRS